MQAAGPDDVVMDATAKYLSGYAAALDYRDLPPDTIHETRRRILDSVGCALAAFAAGPSRIARELAPAVHGGAAARILGTEKATSPDMAAFANTAMIRYLDCNDSFVSPGGGHPSDMLPAVLAAAEVAGASGRAGSGSGGSSPTRSTDSSRTASPPREKGWDQGLFIGLASACAAGKVLGLPQDRLAHAMSMTAVIPGAAGPDPGGRAVHVERLRHRHGRAQRRLRRAAGLGRDGWTSSTFRGPLRPF